MQESWLLCDDRMECSERKVACFSNMHFESGPNRDSHQIPDMAIRESPHYRAIGMGVFAVIGKDILQPDMFLFCILCAIAELAEKNSLA